MISFIIPVLNGSRYIGQCLDHIAAEKAAEDDIIVVDNGSTDDTLDIARRYDNVTILQHPGITIAALRNRGAEVAQNDLLAFIDCDCLVCPGWRQAVEDVMSDKSIVATGSIYDVPEKSTWVERAWLSERADNVMKINYINSGNLIVRSFVYKEIGGFNEALETDEDYDIGARITVKGYTMLHDPAVRVIHLGNAKTLKQHFQRKFWHSTSMLETVKRNGLDKPFIMTLAFLFFGLAFISLLPISLHNKFIFIGSLLGLIVVPVATALYRVLMYKNYRYFFELIILYLVFYLARISALFRAVFGPKRRVA